MRTVRKVLEENQIPLMLAVFAVAVGFVIGMSTHVTLPNENRLEPPPIPSTPTELFLQIFITNSMIAVYSALLGFGLFTAIYSIGEIYGLVYQLFPDKFIIAMMTFGLLELLAEIFAVTQSIILMKYVILKVLGEPVSFLKFLSNAMIVLLFSFATLIISAVLETALILAPPNLQTPVILLGGIITTLYVYTLLYE